MRAVAPAGRGEVEQSMVPGMSERERRAVSERQQEVLADLAREQAIGRLQPAPSPERHAPLPLGIWLGAATVVHSLTQQARVGWEDGTDLVPGRVSDHRPTR
jgi:hypothetical protein